MDVASSAIDGKKTLIQSNLIISPSTIGNSVNAGDKTNAADRIVPLSSAWAASNSVTIGTISPVSNASSVQQAPTNSPMTTQPGGTVVTFSVWDGDWAVLEEYDNTGARVQGYVQGYHGLVKTLVDNIYYYQDELGSTSHIASSTGSLLEYYKYNLYGKPTYFNASGTQLQSSNYSVQDLGDGGARWIPQIGLYDDRNRFMSPDLGRFLQPDSIGFKGDASNLYRYCGNDWANRIDLMGTDSTEKTSANSEWQKTNLDKNSDHDRDDNHTFQSKWSHEEVKSQANVDSQHPANMQKATSEAKEAGHVAQAAVIAGAIAEIPEPRARMAAAVTAGIVVGAAELTRESQRLYETYTMTNPVTGQVYAGRASGFGSASEVLARRYSVPSQLQSFGFGSPVIDRTIMGYPGGYYAIRGREQQLIDHYGGVGSPHVANAVRGVAKLNPAGRAFHELSNLAFGPLAPYTGY